MLLWSLIWCDWKAPKDRRLSSTEAESKKKKKKKSQMFTCCNSESCQCHGDWHAIGIYMGVCMCVNANLAGPSTFKETEYV